MDFVVPVMYAHRHPVWKACKVVIRQAVLAHPDAVALYLLARWLLDAVVGTLAFLATLLTCCRSPFSSSPIPWHFWSSSGRTGSPCRPIARRRARRCFPCRRQDMSAVAERSE